MMRDDGGAIQGQEKKKSLTFFSSQFSISDHLLLCNLKIAKVQKNL